MHPLRAAVRGLPLVVAVTGCASTPTATPKPTAHPSARPSTSPSPTATPAASGPLALLVTNHSRQGATYDALLLDVSGRIVARVTARLPTLKPNQSISLPVADAAATGAYYLDGDTDIHQLRTDGTTPLVKSIAAGSTSALAFAVSPDGQRVAVSVITQRQNDSATTGSGYIEDLADGGGHVGVFTNTSASAYRWPVAWFGNNVVDAVGQGPCNGYQAGALDGCVQALHVVDATTQNRLATACETPTAPSGHNYDWYLTGLPTAAGVACLEEDYPSATNATVSCNLDSVDLSGAHHVFASAQCGAYGVPALSNCFLSPDGGVIACQSASNGALAFISSSGAVRNLGHRYTVLGWLDATHLVTQVDATTLAVLDADTGASTPVTFPGADQVEMYGVVGA